jgi:hypothetical protein
MTGEPEHIVVAMRLNRASRAQNLGVVEAAFRYAARTGIDEVRMEPAFMEPPPAHIAQAVNAWKETGRSEGRRLVLERPSNDEIDLVLSAAAYLVSVSLIARRHEMVTVADAADVLDLEIPRTEWDMLRSELEKALGGPLDYEVAELGSSD